MQSAYASSASFSSGVASASLLNSSANNSTTPRASLAGSRASRQYHRLSEVEKDKVQVLEEVPFLITVDWSTIGYCFYNFGSLIYLVQACLAFSPVDYYAPGVAPFFAADIGGWLGILAALVFLIESTIYVGAWNLGRKYDTTLLWWEDWNFWGNALFSIGSTGYLVTSVFDLLGVYSYLSSVANFWIAVLFVVDAICYIFAMRKGAKARATRQDSFGYASPDGCLTRFYFKSGNVDWYILASLGFLIGSILYVVAAYLDFIEVDTTNLYLTGALLFQVDALLYSISGFQVREEDFELPITQRKVFFLIEYMEDCDDEQTDITTTTDDCNVTDDTAPLNTSII